VVLRSYFIQLTIPANTSEGSPVSTGPNNANSQASVVVPKGVIQYIYPVFPSGSNGLAFVQLLLNGAPVFPDSSNASNYFTGNNTPSLQVPVTIVCSAGGNQLDLQGYNLDTTNAHTISFLLVLETG
jgi:hypothetical protein